MVLKFLLSLIFSINLFAFQIAPSTIDLRALTILVSEELGKNILLSIDIKNLNVDIYFPNNIENKVLFDFYRRALLSKGLYLNRYDGYYAVEKKEKKVIVVTNKKNIKLELTIIEMDNDKFRELGFKSNADSTFKSIFNIGSVFTKTTTFGAFFDLQSTLKLLETNDIINIISNPTVLVKNKETSTMIIGDTVSVLTSSISDDNANNKVRNTYKQQDIGLKIVATPTIRKDGKIDVSVSLNMENLKDYSEGLIATTKRVINSNFSIKSGETIKIGGLIHNYNLKKTHRLPILGYIPVVEYLFMYESEKTINNTLSILIKVTIL
ncbi:hypothetical protein [Sulfurimonas sp.]|uniref:type II secretion system protein GspD n=1 Tax=Sulfurimonas sp. TaxID=2022749 RepID=UPI002B496CE7|nr:hypothetical protein [Sulfurimonas sp.]